MKKQRFLYLAGVVGVVCVVMAVLFMMVSPRSNGGRGETAVSPSSNETNQVGLADGWLTAVSAQLKEAEYAISAVANSQTIAYQSPNRAHNLRTYFSETGIQVEPRIRQGEDWNVGLEIVSVGDGLQSAAPEIESHDVADNRVTLDYGQWQAWYVNEVRGVEQGFTIEEPLFGTQTELLQVDLAVTGNLVPQWVNETEVQLVTAVGEQVLTYQGLYAVDAQGTELPAAMSVLDLGNGRSGIRLSVDVAAAEYPIIVDPFLGGGVDWEGWIAQDANYGFSVSSAGDVNQDGFDDVLVGANWFDGGQPQEGAVFGYYGGPDGLSQAFQWMVEGNMPNLELGYAVNPAGDVNNDGFGDVIIGTHFSPTGKAFVYLGTPAGLSNQPIWEGVGEQAEDGFGTAVNTAGDVNGDGFDDIIIGAPYYDSIAGADSGRAYVFHGPLSMPIQPPDWIGEGGDVGIYFGGQFGYSVSTAGDVNQDGYKDVIIGEPLGKAELIQGRAVIFTGTVSGLLMPAGGTPAGIYDAAWSSEGPTNSISLYGAAVGVAGDVNDDGFSDVIVGAPQYAEFTAPPTGAAFVFTGTNPIGNMNNTVDLFTNWALFVDNQNSLFGYAVGTAGDVDQDGFDDVIVGAPQFDNDFIPGLIAAPSGGGAFVYRGGPSGFVDSWELSSNVANAKLGTSVGTAGDVNGDGYADIIVGAPEMPSPDSTAGEAFSFYGSGQIVNLQAFNDSPTTLGLPTKLWAEVDAGGFLSYDWDLGDGSVSDKDVVAHTYTHPGYFTAVITATSLTDQMTATTAVTISKNSLIDPINGGHLEFVNEETGFGTKVDIPPGAVSQTLKLSYTPLITITNPSPPNSLGYYFDMNVDLPDHQIFLPMIVNGEGSGGGTAVVNAIHSPDTTTESYFFAKPVTVTIVYNDDGLTPSEELSLKLLYWNKAQQDWIDIAAECGLEDTYVYYPDDNYYTVQVCHLSQFGVIH